VKSGRHFAFALTVCALATTAAFSIAAPGDKPMSVIAPTDEQRLAAYLRADEKYHTVPVPAPVDRAVAVRFTTDEVPRASAPAAMRRLVRLALLHDLRETADAFTQVLQATETQPPDFDRSAFAVVALAWLGDGPRVQTAQRYFQSLQRRASAERNRQAMLEACLALGPAEGTAGHREWVGREIATLEALAARHQQQGQAREERAIRMRIDQLREYLLVDVARADRALAVRSRLDAVAPEARAEQLAALYVGGGGEATPEVSWWAGLTLVRSAAGGPSRRDRLGAELLKLARANQAPPPGQTPLEADLRRARALRAAEFLGVALEARDRDWLQAQTDPGTDVLALRPGWNYPGPGA